MVLLPWKQRMVSRSRILGRTSSNSQKPSGSAKSCLAAAIASTNLPRTTNGHASRRIGSDAERSKILDAIARRPGSGNFGNTRWLDSRHAGSHLDDRAEL